MLYSHQPNLFAAPRVWAPVLVDNSADLVWVALDYDQASNRRALTVPLFMRGSSARSGVSLLVQNRDRAFCDIPASEGLPGLSSFTAQLESRLVAQWGELPQSDRRPKKRVLTSFRAWIDYFRCHLTDDHSLAFAVQSPTWRYYEVINGFFPLSYSRNMGHIWLKENSEMRFSVAEEALKKRAKQAHFWMICPHCGVRSVLYSKLYRNAIEFFGVCARCAAGSEFNWACGESLPDGVIPRVLLDDAMDIVLSNGLMVSYSSSLEHLLAAVDFLRLELMFDVTNFRIIGSADLELRLSEMLCQQLGFPSSAKIDAAKSGFIYSASLAEVSP